MSSHSYSCSHSHLDSQLESHLNSRSHPYSYNESIYYLADNITFLIEEIEVINTIINKLVIKEKIDKVLIAINDFTIKYELDTQIPELKNIKNYINNQDLHYITDKYNNDAIYYSQQLLITILLSLNNEAIQELNDIINDKCPDDIDFISNVDKNDNIIEFKEINYIEIIKNLLKENMKPYDISVISPKRKRIINNWFN
jgi:hypothetical protein